MAATRSCKSLQVMLLAIDPESHRYLAVSLPSNTLYDRVDLISCDNPVPTFNSPTKKEQSSQRRR